jgi:hypothetical protein
LCHALEGWNTWSEIYSKYFEFLSTTKPTKDLFG